MDKKLLDLINILLCESLVASHNIRVLHWNLMDDDFVSIHPYLGTLYETITGFIDEAGEQIRIKGEFSFFTLKDCMEETTLGQVDSRKPYTGEEALKIALDNIQTLHDIASEVVTYADSIKAWGDVQIFSNQLTTYAKVLYFLKSSQEK